MCKMWLFYTHPRWLFLICVREYETLLHQYRALLLEHMALLHTPKMTLSDWFPGARKFSTGPFLSSFSPIHLFLFPKCTFARDESFFNEYTCCIKVSTGPFSIFFFFFVHKCDVDIFVCIKSDLQDPSCPYNIFFFKSTWMEIVDSWLLSKFVVPNNSPRIYPHCVLTNPSVFSYSKRTNETGNMDECVSYVHLNFFFPYFKCTYETENICMSVSYVHLDFFFLF